MTDRELYCDGTEHEIYAAVKLTRQPDLRIWYDFPSPAIYASRLATADTVRGTNYVESRMLPLIVNTAKTEGCLRGDCLAHNNRLKAFYARLGLTSLGDITFFSEKLQQNLTVTRLELEV